MFLSRKNHLNCVSLCLELSSWSASPLNTKFNGLGMHLSKSQVPVQMLQVDIAYYIFNGMRGQWMT
jgi:hypothetical protein